jgi:cytochrome c oxidase subunit 2
MKSPLAGRTYRGKRLLFAALAVFALLAFAACSPVGPQDYIGSQEGSQASRSDQLWDLTFGIAAVIFVIVEGLLVFTLFKFRQRPGREAAQFHGNTKLEIILTIIPSLIMAGIAVPTVQAIFDNSAKAEGALEIKVVAHQFWWEYQYPDQDLVTANELHLPVDQPVHLTIQAATEDVIHSFWIPRLAGTQDAVPGRINTLNFVPEETGTFWGQCKEFCGLSHANMRLRVHVEEQGDFDQWVAEQQAPAAAASAEVAQGEELFMQSACAGCHAIEGTNAAGTIGPNLTHFASRETFAGAMFRRTDENLNQWVANAPDMKPGVTMPSGIEELGLSQEDVDAIVAYLQTLK